VLPLWHPGMISGVPVLELMHTSVFYPLNLIFLLDDFPTAFNLYIVLQHFILVFSVYGLTRFWGLSEEAAVCSGITALLGGYFLSLSSIYNHFQSAIWFPLLLFFFQKLLETGRTKYFLSMVFFLFCQVLGGSPENCLLSTALLALYGLLVVPANPGVRESGRCILLLASAVVLSLGLSALQLLPTYEFLEHTTRGRGLSFEMVTSWSIAPESLVHLILPIDFVRFMERKGIGTGFFLQSHYMGLLPLFFMFAGLIGLFRVKALRFWALVFILGVFFALGQHNAFYRFFFDWVPVFDKFRFPEKFMFLSAFSLVFLVGYGVQALQNLASNNSKGMKSLVIYGIIFCAGVYGLSILMNRKGELHALAILVPFILICMMLQSGRLRPSMFKVIVVGLVLADLTLRNLALVPFIDRKFYDEPPVLAEKLKKDSDRFRIYSGPLASDAEVTTKNQFPKSSNQLFSMMMVKDQLRPNLATIYGNVFIDGLTGVILMNDLIWVNKFVFASEELRRRMLKRGNVKFWVTDEFEIPPDGDRPFGLKKVREFDDALPRAFFVPRARQESRKDAIKEYFDEKFDPASEVLLDEEVSWDLREDFQGQVDSIDYRPNGVTITTRQNGDGFLVLLDSYFPGWKVRVDGVPGHVYRANNFYRAVKLGPGPHTLEFHYEPVGFKTGLIVSLVTFLLLMIGISTPALRRRVFPV
jgi:hypothetical protein